MDQPPALALQERIARHVPVGGELGVRVAAVGNHLTALYPEELTAVANAAPARQLEFATGRWLARQVMTDLDIAGAPIPRGPNREPIWPAGVIGSITHTRESAVAAVSRPGHLRGVGVDLERWDRVTPKLHDKLFTSAEQGRLGAAPEEAAGLLFSAKEAGYKATYPLAGRYIGFLEAEVDVDWPAGRFAIRYLGDHAPNRVMNDGHGYFVTCGQDVLSILIII